MRAGMRTHPPPGASLADLGRVDVTPADFKADPFLFSALIASAVEELLRFAGPAEMATERYAKRDVVIARTLMSRSGGREAHRDQEARPGRAHRPSRHAPLSDRPRSRARRACKRPLVQHRGQPRSATSPAGRASRSTIG